MKKLGLLAIGLFSAALFAKEVTIGVVMPMSGPIGGFGQSANKGIELMHKLRPTLSDGTKINIELLDNKSDKIESVNAMKKLISDGAVAVIGALTSTNTLAMTKIADEEKVPMVAPVATNPRVVKNREFVSRVCFSDEFQGLVAARFMYNDLKKGSIGLIIDSKNDYSIGLAKTFEDEIKALGGKIAKKVFITGGEKDFRAQLSALKAANVDAIYIPLYSNEASLIAIQAKQLKLDVPFVGGDGMAADSIFFEVGKDAVEGYMATDYYSPEGDLTSMGKRFKEEYEKLYNERVHTFAAMSADAYNLIVNALEACKDPTDRVCVNKKIRATNGYEGVSGIISLDSSGSAIRSAVINEVKNGTMSYKATVNP